MRQCSKGWGIRCPKSTGTKCRCACGGKNHGAWTITLPKFISESNYSIVGELRASRGLLIKDMGPWDKYKSVTNDAENVVKELISIGMLKSDQRLFYHDSTGRLDEILIKDGHFDGFAPIDETAHRSDDLF